MVQQLRVVDHGVDQAHAQRLGGVELARAEQHVLGDAGPHQARQRGDAGVFVAQAQLRGRDAEARTRRGDAHIGTQRQRQPAADAEALHHRQQRLGQRTQRGAAGRGHLAITVLLLGVGTLLLKFADVGTGRKGLAAGTVHHHHAHRRVGLQGGGGIAQRLPHGQRDGVAFLGLVEGDPAHAAFHARQDLVGGQCHGRHAIVPSLFIVAISSSA
jgi:hypothetical protein